MTDLETRARELAKQVCFEAEGPALDWAYGGKLIAEFALAEQRRALESLRDWVKEWRELHAGEDGFGPVTSGTVLALTHALEALPPSRAGQNHG